MRRKKPAAAKPKRIAPPIASAAAIHHVRRYRPAHARSPANAITHDIVPRNTPAATAGSPARPEPAVTCPGTTVNQKTTFIGLKSVISTPVRKAEPADRVGTVL